MRLPEQFRVVRGDLATKPGDPAGLFLIRDKRNPIPLRVIVSVAMPGMMWDHASVTVVGKNRCPTWDEMCRVKDLFWDAEDAVMQLHPPRSTWVSNHPFCLHLWRPVGESIPLPPPQMVGVQAMGELPPPDQMSDEQIAEVGRVVANETADLTPHLARAFEEAQRKRR